MAWPRLAEYFARFKLSLGMTCNLEVRAPTLSRVPLFVGPATAPNLPAVSVQPPETTTKTAKGSQKKKKARESTGDSDGDSFGDSEQWRNRLDSDSDDDQQTESDESNNNSSDEEKEEPPKVDATTEERLAVWKATQHFLGRPVELMNVAHTVVPIRAKNIKNKSRSKKLTKTGGPQLEIALIVHELEEEEELSEYAFDGLSQGEEDDQASAESIFEDQQPLKTGNEDNASASMVLIRMVNKIPLLDSAEAVACGLVQGLSSKKRMWNSFGLDVGLKIDPSNVGKLPVFEVRDSEQVAPFFKRGPHNLLEEQNDESVSGENSEMDRTTSLGAKRKRPKRCFQNLLPASVRLGNILVIAQIHAEPTTLPLPTLSKVGIPRFCSCPQDRLTTESHLAFFY